MGGGRVATPTIFEVVDVVANEQEKYLRAPDGDLWEILSVFVKVTTTATAGNRRMLLAVLDAPPAGGSTGNEVFRANASAVQVASTTEYYYFVPGGGDASEAFANYHYLPLPPRLFLPSTYAMWIALGGVDSLDDMEVRAMVIVHPG